MPDIHTQLDECQSQCQSLVNEIQKFKQTRELHDTTIQALNSLAAVLQTTLKNVQPLAEPRFRWSVMILLTGTTVNTLLLLAVLLLTTFRG